MVLNKLEKGALEKVIFTSPIGELEFILVNDRLKIVKKSSTKKCTSRLELSHTAKKVHNFFIEYFDNPRSQSHELPLQLNGTDFQKKVWQQLCQIPTGQTQTYSQIAKAIGQAKAPRAVGKACHQNPLLIIVPCHRVIRSDGQFGGFALGLEAKKYLLGLEKKIIEPVFN